MIEAERMVVGAVMLDGQVMRKAARECAPVDFEDERLGAVFAGMGRMSAEQKPIDVVTVSGMLVDWGVRGITAADLHLMVEGVPTASNVDFYAAQVRRGAMQRGGNMVASRLRQRLSEMAPELAVSRARDELAALQEQHTVDELSTVSLHDVLHSDVEYDWVLEGLLERRERVMITGAEGGGKSTLIRQLAITAASGIHPFREYPIAPVSVLVVDAENTQTQWGRETRRWARSAETLEASDPNERLQLACTPRLNLTSDMDLGQVHRLIDQHRPDILFIGPLYRLSPKGINNDDDATPLLAALDTIRDRGIALVIEAHAGHAQNPRGERDMRPRGSSQLLGWPEFGFGLRKNSRNPMHVDVVKWRGDRDQSGERGWPKRLGRAQVQGDQRWPWRPVDV